MISSEFFEALNQIIEEKGIPRDVVISAIEQALLAAYRKKLGQERNLEVEINEKEKAVHVFMIREVVEDTEDFDEEIEILYEDAIENVDPGLRIGDRIAEEIFPEDVGRIAAQTVKQVVIQKIREAERNILFDEFSHRIGQLMNGTVHRVEPRNMLVDLGKAEAVLPWSEQIPRQNFKVGDQIKICIADVDMTTKGPVIRVSRANNEFLIGLFKYYIPEIQEGVVRIRSVVREPGIRSKIAVYCEENRIDPVGACVGLKGSRIKDIVAELSGEKIDIIKWDEDLAVFTNNSLSPAKVTSITIQPDRNSCLVVVPDNQLSLAIGREGQNVRLAARLTGCKIDIKSDSQYKEYLTKLMDGTLHIADDGSVVESESKGEAMDEEIVIGTEAAPVVEPEFTEDSVFMKEVVEEAADDTSEAKSLETGQTI